MFLVGDGAVGVEVQPGFLDEPGGVDQPDLRGRRADEPVRERDCLHRQVVGLAGDRAGSPHRDGSSFDEVEQAGESVGELEGVGEQLLGRLQRDAEGGGEGGGCELIDQRCTGSGQGCAGGEEAVVVFPAGRELVTAGVQQCPVDGEVQLFDLALVREGAGGLDTVDHLGGGEGDGGVHEETLGVGTDSFDKRFEDVENFFGTLIGSSCGLDYPLASLAARPPFRSRPAARSGGSRRSPVRLSQPPKPTATDPRTRTQPPQPQDLEPSDRKANEGVGTPPQPHAYGNHDSSITLTGRPARSRGFETLAGARSSTTDGRCVVSTIRSLRSLLDHLSGPGRQHESGGSRRSPAPSSTTEANRDGPTNQNPAPATTGSRAERPEAERRCRDASATRRLRKPRLPISLTSQPDPVGSAGTCGLDHPLASLAARPPFRSRPAAPSRGFETLAPRPPKNR